MRRWILMKHLKFFMKELVMFAANAFKQVAIWGGMWVVKRNFEETSLERRFRWCGSGLRGWASEGSHSCDMGDSWNVLQRNRSTVWWRRQRCVSSVGNCLEFPSWPSWKGLKFIAIPENQGSGVGWVSKRISFFIVRSFNERFSWWSTLFFVAEEKASELNYPKTSTGFCFASVLVHLEC